MEADLLRDVVKLIDEGICVDRSPQPIAPTVTLVASVRNKERVDDASRFIAELWRKYPLVRLVVGEKSPVEKAVVEMAELLEIPCRVVEQGAKGEWDEGSEIRDSRCVAAATHIVSFDESARSKSYQKMAERSSKHYSVL